MEESVALDSSKQKKFVKSVRGIKKLLKNKEERLEEPLILTKKSVKVRKDGKGKRLNNRGLVYLSHIPHGFYEQQMTEYFKQFGVVTNARVIRSKRTGNSKGYAFVEFKEPAVAEIVAETTNNYLMGKRLIKAVYIPPEKQRKNALRKKWNTQNNPSSNERLKLKKLHNENKSDDQELKMAIKLLANLSKNRKKLSKLGIDYDFFKPVDVPKDLVDKVDDIAQTDVKLKKQVKNESKDLKSNIKVKNETNDVKTKKSTKKGQQETQSEKIEVSTTGEIVEKKAEREKAKLKDVNKDNKEVKNKINKIQEEKQQLKKQDKLKKTKSKALGNFISIKESNDSDSSIDFDSDEFDKMIEDDDDDDNLSSDNKSESKGESDSESEIDEKEIIVRSKKAAKGSHNKRKAALDLNNQKKQSQANEKQNKSLKRKTAQSPAVTLKKAKFEKQNSKLPRNKVTKKRK